MGPPPSGSHLTLTPTLTLTLTLTLTRTPTLTLTLTLTPTRYGVADNEYKQTALNFWTDKRPTFWPAGEPYPWVWRWARARFLHATQPADTTIYQNLREAFPLLLTIISLYPPTRLGTGLGLGLANRNS